MTKGMSARVLDTRFSQPTDDDLRDQRRFDEVAIRLAENQFVVMIIAPKKTFLLAKPRFFELVLERRSAFRPAEPKI
jgi:hypothetical protein